MIELKNSKTTQISPNRYVSDCYIGAAQMLHPVNGWTDIKPRLVRDSTGWHTEGTPYYAEIKDDGERVIYPEFEGNKKIRIPGFPILQGLKLNPSIGQTKLTHEFLTNRILMPTPYGEIRYLFGNSGVKFEIFFTKAPPKFLFGESPRILLDIDSDYDLDALLSEKKGLGIPRPRLICKDDEQKHFSWSLKHGQMELGFDFEGLTFPCLLKNTTIDEQVGASTDDCRMRYDETDTQWEPSLTDTDHELGTTFELTRNKAGSGNRFTSTGVAQGSTITTANIDVYAVTSLSTTTVNAKIRAEDADDSATFDGSEQDYFGDRPRTNAEVVLSNIAAWTATNWYLSSTEIKTVIQELVDRGSFAEDDITIFLDDHDGLSTQSDGVQRVGGCYGHDDNSYGMKLHVEYEVAGAEAYGYVI